MAGSNCRIAHYQDCGDNEKYAKICLYPEKDTEWSSGAEDVLFDAVAGSKGNADNCRYFDWVESMPSDPGRLNLFLMQYVNPERAERFSRTIFSRDVLTCRVTNDPKPDPSLQYYFLGQGLWLTCR